MYLYMYMSEIHFRRKRNWHNTYQNTWRFSGLFSPKKEAFRLQREAFSKVALFFSHFGPELHPRKLTAGTQENGGWGGCFSFFKGVSSGPMLVFGDVKVWTLCFLLNIKYTIVNPPKLSSFGTVRFQMEKTKRPSWIPAITWIPAMTWHRRIVSDW